ncbi:MAG TPA: MoaD/ThiS family protein [Jatrophihabitantaceae bacterium]|jgi:molybdopterin synthase sulfur carrier subunit|nr:MoaD/ThiS family protein [Jatrophihabitantaceae bacterium]
MPASTPSTVTVRYFAAARAAAGLAEEYVEAGTVRDALTAIRDRHGARLGRILDCCSFLLDGHAVHDDSAALGASAQLDVLPPFAGG